MTFEKVASCRFSRLVGCSCLARSSDATPYPVLVDVLADLVLVRRQRYTRVKTKVKYYINVTCSVHTVRCTGRPISCDHLHASPRSPSRPSCNCNARAPKVPIRRAPAGPQSRYCRYSPHPWIPQRRNAALAAVPCHSARLRPSSALLCAGLLAPSSLCLALPRLLRLMAHEGPKHPLGNPSHPNSVTDDGRLGEATLTGAARSTCTCNLAVYTRNLLYLRPAEHCIPRDSSIPQVIKPLKHGVSLTNSPTSFALLMKPSADANSTSTSTSTQNQHESAQAWIWSPNPAPRDVPPSTLLPPKTGRAGAKVRPPHLSVPADSRAQSWANGRLPSIARFGGLRQRLRVDYGGSEAVHAARGRPGVQVRQVSLKFRKSHLSPDRQAG